MEPLSSHGPPREARTVVRLLGGAVVEVDGRRIHRLSTLRMQRLLARLALSPTGSLRRDRLAWELWPGSAEAQARTNLRKLLHDVRRSLPEPDLLLRLDADYVAWCDDPPVWTDVGAFTT